MPTSPEPVGGLPGTMYTGADKPLQEKHNVQQLYIFFIISAILLLFFM